MANNECTEMTCIYHGEANRQARADREAAAAEAEYRADLEAGSQHEEEILRAQAEYERAEWEAEATMAYYDDDPNPYHGDYSEM
jgi:hypothetical protein